MAERVLFGQSLFVVQVEGEANTKYVLMFCPTEEDQERIQAMPVEAQAELTGQATRWLQKHRVTTYARLAPPTTATTVRFKNDGSPVVTDGPFVEAKESIGGVAFIEAEDLDEALKVAKGWPPRITVEIRPMLEPPQS